MHKIISVTDLIRNAARITDDVETNATVYRITRGGRGSSVLVNEQYFEGWMHALDEMRRPDFKQVFDETTADIEAGRGRALDEIEKELGLAGPTHKTRRAAAKKPARSRAKKRR